MDRASFTEKSSGVLVPTIRDQHAFLPNPLPPETPISQELASALEDATLAVGELSGISGFIQDVDLIARPLLTREAIYSSRIEGTYASAEDLALIGVGSPTVPQYSDSWEVFSYLDAVHVGMRRIETQQIDIDLMRDLHRRLLGDLFSRGRSATPGEFRTIQNYIGASSATPISAARFVPPPPAEMVEALDALASFIVTDTELPALLRIALIHYQFEAIHPFVDGNGRIGRILITLLLAKWGLVKQPILHLSAFFDQERDRYIQLLLKVSTNGAWDEWIIFFLTGIATQAREAAKRVRRLWQLRQDYMERVRMPQASALLPRLVDELFAKQMITIPQAAKLLDVTYPSARKNIHRLIDSGILKESPRKGLRNSRLFVASEILLVAHDADES